MLDNPSRVDRLSVFSAVCIFLLLLPFKSFSVELERPPYLQLSAHDGIVVRWRTDLPTDTRLHYGSSPSVLDQVESIPGSRTEHEVALNGLSPDTVYFYDVGDAEGVLAGGDSDHFFRTSPSPGVSKPFRMWVVGDSGDPNNNVVRVRDSFLSLVGGKTPDIVLMLGDNAYPDGSDLDHTSGLFQMFPMILRSAHLWSVPGNHEFVTADSPTQTGPYFDAFTLPTSGEVGGVPSNTEAYYSFDHGNVHFVALDSTDSNRLTNGAMYQWLMADLIANTNEWVIALWHHPPYSRGTHDSDTTFEEIQMRENFLPLLEDYGLDLMFSGHSHAYERSMLIDGHYGDSSTFSAANIVDGGDGDPLGTGPYLKPSGSIAHMGGVFAVVGSSSLLSIGGGSFDHPVMARSIASYGSAIVDVNGNTLRVRFLNDTGQILDEAVIVKGVTCSDGMDNDGDGLVDLLDPGCIDGADLTETDSMVVCDDAADNDGDGLIDLFDPGCADRSDPSEQSAVLVCDNGIDEDADTLVDRMDPGCADSLDPSELNAAVQCDDGLDNDGDGAVDGADQDCLDPLGKDESGLLARSVSIPIADDSDDVEERVSTDGSINMNSGNLKLVVNNSITQAVGLRFAGVPIPQGAAIQSVHIRFTSDRVNVDPASLLISAEASDNALPFTTSPGNVSLRLRTSMSTNWIPNPWLGVGLSGPDQRTPDLAQVVQEVTDRSGWQNGNAMVFVITGTGVRTAESATGAPGASARFEATYIPSPSMPATYHYIGNRFQSASAPYTTEMSISLSFTLARALAPGVTDFNALADVVAFTYSDGTQTLTEADGPYFASEFRVSTNAAGEIVDWALADLAMPTNGAFVCGPQSSVVSAKGCSIYPNFDGVGFTGTSFIGQIVNQPGVWGDGPLPEPIFVPTSPLALILALIAVLGLGICAKSPSHSGMQSNSRFDDRI